MIENLKICGYENVYNRKEDFYKVAAEDRVPDNDILITNPPYSEDHIEKLLAFCAKSSKPHCLLLPNFVYLKEYFPKYCASLCGNPIFLVPRKRYLYTTPFGRRQAKSAKYTSPFATFWYVWLGRTTPTTTLISSLESNEQVKVCRVSSQIPFEAMPENDPCKKRMKNAQKRVKNKDRKKRKMSGNLEINMTNGYKVAN